MATRNIPLTLRHAAKLKEKRGSNVQKDALPRV
jgi:hypothetical protein